MERLFDGSCVHHVPAVVVHEAQEIFDSLLEAGARAVDESANQVRLQADAMVREDLLRRQIDLSRDQTNYLNGQLNWLSGQKLEVERLLQESREELGRKEETLQATRLDLGRTEELLQATRLDLGRTEELLHRSEREVSESHAGHAQEPTTSSSRLSHDSRIYEPALIDSKAIGSSRWP